MMEVATEIQHKVIRFLRFIVRFLASKIDYLLMIRNYFFLNGSFLELSGIEKAIQNLDSCFCVIFLLL